MAHLGIADYLIESSSIPEIEKELEHAHLLRDKESIDEFLL